jgi:hypothetical protein
VQLLGRSVDMRLLLTQTINSLLRGALEQAIPRKIILI